MEKIGIGITTRNRRELFQQSCLGIYENAPNFTKLVIVDDGSDKPCDFDFIRRHTGWEPLPHQHHRFTTSQGIAAAKNKCLELLEDCDHIFLFDDDIWPVRQNWWKPYVESPDEHLCHSFENDAYGNRMSPSVYITRSLEDINVFNAPNGCMLYLTKKVLETVGGMDTRFGTWGYEHVEYSRRIHNAGLTSYPYMDIVNSTELFYSADRHRAVVSSVSSKERAASAAKNKILLEETKNSKEFINYKS